MTIIETTYNKIYGVQRSNLHTQANISTRKNHVEQSSKFNLPKHSEHLSFANQSHKTAPAPLVDERNCGTRHNPSVKEKAIAMRKEGKVYGEILAVISVAKSTLSLWLREVGLSIPQKQHITKLRKQAQQKGARVRHEMAVEKRDGIYDISRDQIGGLSDREVWLLATMAYWAEGTKEKSYRGGQGFDFANMDPRMARVLIYWLIYIQKVPQSDIKFEIYIHENSKKKVKIVQEYWSKELSVPVADLQKVRYKTHKINTNRKNTGDLYYGLIRVKVVASSTLTRQLEGWAQGIDGVIKSKITLNP